MVLHQTRTTEATMTWLALSKHASIIITSAQTGGASTAIFGPIVAKPHSRPPLMGVIIIRLACHAGERTSRDDTIARC